MMKPENRKILLFTAFSLIFACGAAGQAKNVGATFSLNGLAASYEHFIESESFIELSLKAECGDMFFGLSSYTGVSASITWNMIFARKESCNGNEIRMFAGPGMLVGWGNDFLRPPGFILGLKGRVGAECEFDRNVTVSASLCPVIGTHMKFFEDHVDMRCYRSGLISAVLPVIGIKYTF